MTSREWRDHAQLWLVIGIPFWVLMLIFTACWLALRFGPLALIGIGFAAGVVCAGVYLFSTWKAGRVAEIERLQEEFNKKL